MSLPINTILKPKTQLGKDALKLYNAAEVAARRIADCGVAEREAADALRAARDAYQNELARGGREGVDPDRETSLAQALAAAEHRAAPGAFQIRRRAAEDGVKEATWSYVSFLRQSRDELLKGEFETDSIKVGEDVAAARAALVPVEDAYRKQHERMRQFLNTAVTPGRSNHDQAATLGVETDIDVARRWSLPTDGVTPPLPARHLWDDNAEPEGALPLTTTNGIPVGLTPQAAAKLGLVTID